MISQLLSCLLLAVVNGQSQSALPDVTLPATDHVDYKLREVGSRASFTVIVFFSDSCPCQSAHDARLVDLYHKYKDQGVQILLVDSNFSATIDEDAKEVASRHYPFPILVDHDGEVMKALGAKYATYSVVLDSTGRIRYRGGFDSDRHPITDHAKPYLDDAVKSLLAGRDPNPAETKSLGCALERW